jgi:amino acid permease
MKLPRAFYEGTATLMGCIIGAGIFGIPYVVVRAGFWTGMLVLAVLGLAILIIHLLLGEVTLRTNACHQLVGYAEKYLGRAGKFWMMASMIIGVYGALVAYTLGVSESLTAIFGGYRWLWALLFYLIMSSMIYGGLRFLERFELIIGLSMLALFAVIAAFLFGSSQFTFDNWLGFSWTRILIPYGVILFAFTGTAAVPEMREEMKKCKLLTKHAIVFGSLIPFLIYALFTAAVIGVTGAFTTEVATIGVASKLGGIAFVLLHLFAVVAMSTSFFALGYALMQAYHLDFRLPRTESWALTAAIPLFLIMLGARSFVGVLEVAGVFAGGITGIIVVLMHAVARKRSDRKPEYVVRMNLFGYGALILLFLIGMLYELFLIL